VVEAMPNPPGAGVLTEGRLFWYLTSTETP
jgi:hypothetical protein